MAGKSISYYTPASPQVLANWHYMMQRSMVKANRAIQAWEKRSAEVNEICDLRGLSKSLRIFHRRDDLELKDHYATYEFFAGEVRRFSLMIQAELAMRELMRNASD